MKRTHEMVCLQFCCFRVREMFAYEVALGEVRTCLPQPHRLIPLSLVACATCYTPMGSIGSRDLLSAERAVVTGISRLPLILTESDFRASWQSVQFRRGVSLPGWRRESDRHSRRPGTPTGATRRFPQGSVDELSCHLGVSALDHHGAHTRECSSSGEVWPYPCGKIGLHQVVAEMSTVPGSCVFVGSAMCGSWESW